ncbi:MAG: peptide chain release factor 1 [Flavobacteriales bacterium]|nr:peptide chain release factor 1 [Flavobacteriales bacterium]
MIEKLEAIVDRYHQLEESLADPDVISDMSRFTKISKQYKDLKAIVNTFNNYKDVIGNLDTAKEMLSEDDDEMKEMAKAEIAELSKDQERIEEELKFLLIPQDPNDSKDVVFEIRAGTGGDEAAIFAGDLYRMYSKFFESKGWKTEIISINEGSVGGYSKITLEVKGDEVFGNLKFESGAHRVQRVPKTESQGRVHTSAATVVVMPKLEMEDVDINKADLQVDTFRSSGAGGQHVNKTESGVRFTHIPTGAVAESTDGRSQHKNREIAIQRLYQKIFEAKQAKYNQEIASKRKTLVGSGDRSDKIRTYNYPQNRVTDHRINLTLYSLDKIVLGDIGGIIEELKLFENTEKLKAGESII